MRSKTIVLFSVFAAVALIATEPVLFPLLKSTVSLGRQPGGFYLLPTNQLLRSWGEQTLIKGRPVDVAMDSRKHLLAVLNWRGVLLVDAASGAEVGEVRSRATSYIGIAFRPGDREVWASETSANGPDNILIVKLSETGAVEDIERIKLDGHAVPCGIAFSSDGNTAYVALSLKDSVAVIDAKERQVKRLIPVGTAPFGVAAARQSRRVFVSNRGGRHAEAHDSVAPSSGQAIVSDPATGSSATGTVSVIDLESGKLSDVAVGLAPSVMALSPDESILAVANAHSDSISLIDTRTLSPKELKIPAYPATTVGSLPTSNRFRGVLLRRPPDVRCLRRQQCDCRGGTSRKRLEVGRLCSSGLVSIGNRGRSRWRAARGEHQRNWKYGDRRHPGPFSIHGLRRISAQDSSATTCSNRIRYAGGSGRE